MEHPDFRGLREQREGSILGRVLARKRADVAERQRLIPLTMLERRLSRSDRSLAFALEAARNRSPALIAEVKRRSPSRGVLREDVPVEAIAAIYERHASAISVVSDEPFFGGSLEMLREVRARVSRPVLLKDFVISEYQIVEGRAHGADAVLLMLSVLEPDAVERMIRVARDYGMDALVEAHTEDELGEALATSARVIGINNRDLHTLRIDPETFHRLAPRIGGTRLSVAESGIDSRQKVDRLRGSAQGVLIGSALMEAPDIEARIFELGF